MDFNTYQKLAKSTFLVNPHTNFSLVISRMVLGICGEAGEIAEKFKKILRDKDGKINKEFKESVAKEVGDVLWYLAVLCDLLDIKLGDVAQANVDKLASRRDRGVLKGSGDNR